MARPSCMLDVWDLALQEKMVEAHAQDTQVLPTEGCDDKHLTGKDIINLNKKPYVIK